MGIQLNLSLIDSGFQKKSSSLYELSILIRMDSLVYAVSNQEGKLLVLKEYEINTDSTLIEASEVFLQVKAIFEADELLKFLYRKCHISLGNNIVALVPTRLFNVPNVRTYLQELTTLKETASIGFDEIPSIKTMVVFEEDPVVKKILKSAQPNSKLFHKTTPFLIGCTQKAQKISNQIVFANFSKTSVEICFFDKGQLYFHNHFNFQSTPDALYYVLLIFEQFQLEANVVPLLLSGTIDVYSAIYKSIYRYIRQISFILPPANIRVNSTFKKISTHSYFNLFCLTLL